MLATMRRLLLSLVVLCSVGVAQAACPIQEVSAAVLSLASTSSAEIHVYGSHSSKFELCVAGFFDFGVTNLQSVTVYGSGQVTLRLNGFRGLSKLKITHTQPEATGTACTSVKTIPIYVPRASGENSKIQDCDSTAVDFQFQPHTSTAPNTVRFDVRARNTGTDNSFPAASCIRGLFGGVCTGPGMLLDAARIGGYDNIMPMNPGCKSVWKSALLSLEGTGAGFSTCSATTGFTGTGTSSEPYRVAFDGTDDKYTVPNSNLINGPRLTVEVWFRFPENANRHIVSRYAANTYGWGMSLTAGGLLNAEFGATTMQIVSSNTLAVNTWYHAVMTLDNGTGKLYVNGASVGGEKTGLPGDLNSHTSGPSVIVGNFGASYFKGDLAWLAVSGNRGATQEEVSEMCKVNQGRYGVTCA